MAFEGATKLIGHIPVYPKHYQCVLKLGESTETADCTGEVVEESQTSHRLPRLIEKRFPHFTGEISQTPPKYSAIKVNGKRLYEYARQGLDVEIPSRIVEIHQLAILEKEVGLLDPQSEVGFDCVLF